MKQKTDKNFVSEEDKFLSKLRANLPESPSQRQERLKHAAIARKRDHSEAKPNNDLWEKF
jgi:hypothetical protein